MNSKTNNCTIWNNTLKKKKLELYHVFENNIREMMTTISNTNAKMQECIFINFLQHFLSNLTNFCLYLIFLTLTDQEQVLEIRLPLDAPTRKNHLELCQGSKVALTTQYTLHDETIAKFFF